MSLAPSIRKAFDGKTVLLTGAGSGIGRSLAHHLVASGAKVHAADMNAAGLDVLAAEVSGGPGTLVPRVLNVTDRADYGRWVEECVVSSGTLDYLFNNAGVTLLGEAHKVPFERWKWLLDINLMGVLNGVMQVYPVMVKQGRGHIISTGSVAGVTGYATAAAYTTAKKAVIGMSHSLAAEAKAYGVKVTVVCPGYVNSNIFSQDRVVGANVKEVIDDLPAPMMSPDEAARHYLAGVSKGKRTVVFPANAKLLWFLGRWIPIVLRPIQERLMRKFVSR
ncbi:SDR family NAD(P)-dependent oxidoreductase [Luteolibacter luteus]|uniref:SDR family oxidoreductase n=1 Tax=Luteolibacter luteus TaxID=2728835 RepID=A0A858RDM4_9BACT|nr:SDR family oxidoreductase [Luteolibacter luteus]QJE95176.1 SDR family oxidoreductase [Luteolibacter luteus]